MPARRRGDRGGRHLRLGLAVARRIEGAGPGLRGAGQQARDLGSVDDPRIELVVAGVIEPAGEPPEIVRLPARYMMPQVRKPVSASTRWFIPCHRRRLSMTSGISRGSRAILRHQPQLRLDCSPAMWPFSHSTVETPFSARNSAALVPIMPPPMITTSARAGRVSSVATGSTRGAISHLRNSRFGGRILAAMNSLVSGNFSPGRDRGGREA